MGKAESGWDQLLDREPEDKPRLAAALRASDPFQDEESE